MCLDDQYVQREGQFYRIRRINRFAFSLSRLLCQVFLFLWWWFVLVAVFTCLNFLYWLFVTISGSSRHQFIRKYLKAYQQGIQTSKDSQQTIPFTNEFIRPDGIFVLRLISDTAGDIVTTALVGKLWESFKRDRRPTTKIEENEPLVVEKPIFPV